MNNTVDDDPSEWDYGRYDDMRMNPEYTYTPMVSDRPNYVGRNLYRIEETNEIVCHVPTFLRWTQHIKPNEPREDGDFHAGDLDESFGASSAALLAMHHFNTGNGNIVRELGGISDQCPIRFTTELVDTQSSVGTAMLKLNSYLNRPPVGEANQACAVLGSSWSSVTNRMISLTGSFDLPHVASIPSGGAIGGGGDFSMFSRTNPSDTSMAYMSLHYLKNQLGVDWVGLFHIDNSYFGPYHGELMRLAHHFEMRFQWAPYRGKDNDEKIKQNLGHLKKLGFRYFMGVWPPEDHERIMNAAMELGMAGPGYFWLFNSAMAGSFLDGNQLTLPVNSPAYQATVGSAILTDVAGMPNWDEGHDRFREEWRKIGDNEDFLNYIISKQPKPEVYSNSTVQDFFQNLEPSSAAAYTYDAVANLGMSACQVLEGWDRPGVFPGFEHINKFVQNKFQGASGRVEFDRRAKARSQTSSTHVVYTIQPQPTSEDGMEALVGSPWAVFDTQKQGWELVDPSQSYVFAGGLTEKPIQIPQLRAEYNYVSGTVRGVCLTLSALAILLSIGFFVFSNVLYHNHRVIRTAQPFFLGLICLGAFLMAASIIPVTLDDGIVSERACDVACITQFWLLPVGFGLVFSALFSKLWRVNRLLAGGAALKRIEVTARDVMLPLVVLMGLNVTVLTLWTVLDPLHWDRESVSMDMFDRVHESVGTCKSDNMGAFAFPLLAVNGAALVLALWQAYVGRHITTDLNESTYIAMATVCIFQALFMGAPVIVIVEDQPSTFVFIYSMVVSIICFSILLLIFVPKILAMRKREEAPRKTTQFSLNGGTRVSGGFQGSNAVNISMSGAVSSQSSARNVVSFTDSMAEPKVEDHSASVVESECSKPPNNDQGDQ